MKENDIIERLHKAYDVKEPDVLSKLNFSQVEMVPSPEKSLKKRYLSAVAIYAAACLVVAITLPFLIGGGGNDNPKPQPGVSPVGTETADSNYVTAEPEVDDSEILDEFMEALERAILEHRLDDLNLKKEDFEELYPEEGAKYGIHVFMANEAIAYIYCDGEAYDIPVKLYNAYSHTNDSRKYEKIQFVDIDKNGKYDLLINGMYGSGAPTYQMEYFDSVRKTFTTLYKGTFNNVKTEDEVDESGEIKYNLYVHPYRSTEDSITYIGELVYKDGEVVPELIRYGIIEDVVREVVGELGITDTSTESPVSIDVYPISVETSEAETIGEPSDPEPDEPAVVTSEKNTPPEETTTTTGKRFDPVGTSATTKKPNPAPKVYADPAGAVRVYFYKDIDHTQKYSSAKDIPYGAKVYYEIETDPGYICTNFSINVYKSSFNVDLVSNDACESAVDYFINNYHGECLDYSLTAVLAGDSNGDLTYDMDDVETIRKYIAGDTTTRWLYGRYGYSEKLDYDCSGGINENDVNGVLSEIENGDAERNTMASNRYCGSYIGTRSRLLDLDNAVVLPHGMNPKYIEYDCNVYKDVSYMNGFSEEVKEKYDDHFFISHDLIVIYCYTENGEIPTVSELYDVWITGNSTSAYINPVYSDDNAGQTLSDYAIFIPISANVRLQDNAPM